MNSGKPILLTLLTSVLFSLFLNAQKPSPITVNVDKPGAKIQPTMWGIFFEDINFAADGGIYAELVKNRSFEFTRPKMGWSVSRTLSDSSHFIVINRTGSNENNPRFARITLREGTGPFYLANSGFRGMGIKQNNRYNFSILASLPGNDRIKMRVELLTSAGTVAGEVTITPEGKGWKKYEASLTSASTDLKGSMRVWFEGTGVIDIDMVSLFPADTWKGRKNGLRSDLVQLLADMKPGFIRFPGGCIVEGFDLSVRYQWKKTVGPVEERKTIINRWNTEFAHRLTPDYFQSFGLGFYEYFLLAEDIGAEPLPIINCGMACQFNTAEVVPLDQMEPYIQDALDLIEFANGAPETRWGSIRAGMGHPEPFNLKYLGVGNEQWGPQYFERYALFEKAIKAKFPSVSLVSGTGPQPDDELFHFAVQALKDVKPELVDEHYYRPPAWFRENAARYDSYDRTAYKIFAGEYAAQSVRTVSPDNKNNWECALSEAAFMTGLERNADVVQMCSYAPLFAHVDAWQWTPDLIWFNNLKSYGTANYHVQKLFSVNRGTNVLDILQDGKPLTGQKELYASAALDSDTRTIILKIVNTASSVQTTNIVLQTRGRVSPRADMTVLRHDSLSAMNTIEKPDEVVPSEQQITLSGKTLTLQAAPYSFSIIRIKLL